MQQGQDYKRFGYQPLQGMSRNINAQKPQGFGAEQYNNHSKRNLGGFLMSRITRSPLLSTFGILAAGGVFAFALYNFYPSSDPAETVVPVIKAEATPIKIEPVKVGGMDIPFRDSTIYDSIRAENVQATRIENLLEPAAGDEEPMSRQEVAEKVKEQVGEPAIINITESITPVEKAVEGAEVVAKADIKPELQKIVVPETAKPIRNILEDAPAEVVSSEPRAVESESKTMHKPAASPETLAFVRSVLDKKDAEKAMKSPELNKVGAAVVKKSDTVKVDIKPATIEPAAGTEGQIITKGSHYVQLASITDRARANKEWTKLKEEMSAIPGASGYRVQEANLEKGTFYRIQAGPYSEAQARSICESIKAQKPGGCFVVK